ncbi:hypothetical protein E0L36_09545 [Streptomyces sp. AJS327]|uniref:hypothetical protein n=1 Tax=Streptomyces sp. AJS327 TaxID=2545265 RepID=UPI0015DEA1B5|nr:hypothetical protein [Streptomyces sp. AJS327]MBA0051127.1 hypothetical protein [Streptomyces sp. AJS327]
MSIHSGFPLPPHEKAALLRELRASPETHSARRRRLGVVTIMLALLAALLLFLPSTHTGQANSDEEAPAYACGSVILPKDVVNGHYSRGTHGCVAKRARYAGWAGLALVSAALNAGVAIVLRERARGRDAGPRD